MPFFGSQPARPLAVLPTEIYVALLRASALDEAYSRFECPAAPDRQLARRPEVKSDSGWGRTNKSNDKKNRKMRIFANVLVL